jgi:hypothetical protein
MDTEKLRTILEAIPPGRWVSYADVDRASQEQRVRPEAHARVAALGIP